MVILIFVNGFSDPRGVASPNTKVFDIKAVFV